MIDIVLHYIDTIAPFLWSMIQLLSTISLFLNYLFLAALGLCCCRFSFSSCGERKLPFVAVRRLLPVVASLAAEHGLQVCGLSRCSMWAPECSFSSCGTQTQLSGCMWDLPGLGIEPVFPALASGFLATGLQGKLQAKS